MKIIILTDEYVIVYYGNDDYTCSYIIGQRINVGLKNKLDHPIREELK